MKAVVAAFNQEKALVGAFSVITNLRMELFEALVQAPRQQLPAHPAGVLPLVPLRALAHSSHLLRLVSLLRLWPQHHFKR